MANTTDTPFRRWARANFTTSFLYPLTVSCAAFQIHSELRTNDFLTGSFVLRETQIYVAPS